MTNIYFFLGTFLLLTACIPFLLALVVAYLNNLTELVQTKYRYELTEAALNNEPGITIQTSPWGIDYYDGERWVFKNLEHAGTKQIKSIKNTLTTWKLHPIELHLRQLLDPDLEDQEDIKL